MDIVGPEIRLDRAVEAVNFDLREWVVEAAWPILHHKPSRINFWIGIPPSMEDEIDISDVVARPHHISDGYAVPADAELLALGRAAIAVWLTVFGALLDPLDNEIPA